MPEIRSEGVHGRVFLPQQLGGIVEDNDDWNRAHCLIKCVAQDQAIIRINRGRGIETYTGLLRGFDQDSQSEAVAVFATKAIEPVDWDAVLKAMNSQLTLAWHGGDVRAKTIVNLDAPALTSKPDDEVSVDDENPAEWTADRLAGELLELDAENDWPRLRELILVAEDTGFTHEQSAQLAPRLLGFAMQHRESNNPQDEPIVWSAIRTGASMLRPNEAHRLLPLLEPGHSIETSRVALKMLGRIFEAQPPDGVERYPALAKKVSEIAKSLLNRYVIASRQSAAMAQLAIYALAAMGSSSSLKVVALVRLLDVAWFTRQTGRDLRELRGYWDHLPSPVPTGPRDLLNQALQELDVD